MAFEANTLKYFNQLTGELIGHQLLKIGITINQHQQTNKQTKNSTIDLNHCFISSS